MFLDAAGTLFETYPSVGAIYHRFGKRYGSEVSAEHLDELFAEVWRSRDRDALRQKDSSPTDEREFWRSILVAVYRRAGMFDGIDRFFDEVYAFFSTGGAWRLFPDTMPLLNELRRRGKQTIIVSNWTVALYDICRDLQVDRRVDGIIASGDVKMSKPDPRIFELALRKAGCKPREAVHIGDSLAHDIEGARAAGIDAIWLDRQSRASSSDRERYVVAHDLMQLIG
ncbi:MAG: HAD-IA family hydrolase [Myxococcota bacterium]